MAVKTALRLFFSGRVASALFLCLFFLLPLSSLSCWRRCTSSSGSCSCHNILRRLRHADRWASVTAISVQPIGFSDYMRAWPLSVVTFIIIAITMVLSLCTAGFITFIRIVVSSSFLSSSENMPWRTLFLSNCMPFLEPLFFRMLDVWQLKWFPTTLNTCTWSRKREGETRVEHPSLDIFAITCRNIQLAGSCCCRLLLVEQPV